MAKDSIKVRLPGLGGQGAVTAAHIAATAADTDGYYAVSNPFFGAEKRMAPSESYARIGTVPIYDRGEVIYPDIVMIFHPQVITMGKSYTMPFYAGIKENGLVIINSEVELLTEHDKKVLSDLNVKVLTKDFTQFAIDQAGTELATNMAMLGALFGALGTVSKAAIEEGIKDRFLKKYTASGGTATLDSVIEKKFKKKQELIQKNLDTASAAYDLTAAWAKEVGLEPILEPSKNNNGNK
ncbi:ferredoxin oxidoreductase [Sulfurimonas aquatica]|uniref:Ferredoxin oxidoreductase n=1 Tax=Sulfurimonas aquatica TaxID=2672570 RepID=A0A975B1J5_9BACT|nr:2-oxoacid:acceptor oxidoreductase family protein [Sulfurimonas aquatica]QSZ42542.1 ferredoxin oxidoreductase [Sulfurimonas aquatica]QSZ42566.1 ferredoxin oxidoreductase [Sulfurimonas aquatica]